MIIINDRTYPVRSLTLPEVRKCRSMETDAADVAAIAWATGCLYRDVEEWFNGVPAGEAMAAVQAVFEASGLAEGAQKSG